MGSPPRMRGKQTTKQTYRPDKRITPADAGKTAFAVGYCVSVEDHPRRCGENSRSQAGRRHRLGSPPQVRGKLQAATGAVAQKRITPAGAGKTLSPNIGRGRFLDHPRRCGENTLSILCRLISRGSPPQVRGKPAAVWAHTALRRITPADAGKTFR